MRVLEAGRFPVFSMPSDQSGSKILFKSPFELLEAPIGPGGVFSLLYNQKIHDAFNQMGIEYVQVGPKLFISLFRPRNFCSLLEVHYACSIFLYMVYFGPTKVQLDV